VSKQKTQKQHNETAQKHCRCLYVPRQGLSNSAQRFIAGNSILVDNSPVGTAEKRGYQNVSFICQQHNALRIQHEGTHEMDNAGFEKTSIPIYGRHC